MIDQKLLEQLSEIFAFIDPATIKEASPAVIEQIIRSDIWPPAIDPKHIITNEFAVIHRAKLIVSEYLPLLNGKKFLDFGCGDGSVCVAAKEAGAIAFGYDIKTAPEWAATAGQIPLTTDTATLKEEKPFDVILVYDVLDHIRDQDSLDTALDLLRKWSSANTALIIRIHPWTARHGIHQYEKLNKAFAHYFLSKDAMAGIAGHFTRFVLNPERFYSLAFAKHGFETVTKVTRTSQLEGVFKSSQIANKIKRLFHSEKLDLQAIHAIMQTDYIDYRLKLK